MFTHIVEYTYLINSTKLFLVYFNRLQQTIHCNRLWLVQIPEMTNIICDPLRFVIVNGSNVPISTIIHEVGLTRTHTNSYVTYKYLQDIWIPLKKYVGTYMRTCKKIPFIQASILEGGKSQKWILVYSDQPIIVAHEN